MYVCDKFKIIVLVRCAVFVESSVCSFFGAFLHFPIGILLGGAAQDICETIPSIATEHLQHLAFTSKKMYEEFLIKILQSLFNNTLYMRFLSVNNRQCMYIIPTTN